MSSPLSEQQIDALLQAALAAQKTAYAPYSKFRVGAALLLEDGTVVPGCNVENASFGATICAERTAMTAAVAAHGAPGVKPIAVAVVGPTDKPLTPCGVCRQFLSEFNLDLQVICATQNLSERLSMSLRELLPHSFDGSALPE
jgi:cytidine deaminase